MAEIIRKHKLIWAQKYFLLDVILGLLFVALGILAAYFANLYTAERVSNSVTDILLDNIPVINVSLVFTEGALLFLITTAVILLFEPSRIPFVIKSIGLFILVRSFFMILTHIAPPAVHSYLNTSDPFYAISSGDDLFFSSHTGFPFLLAMIFWNNKYLKYFFLTCSVIGAAIVLLGHLHYSIDVFAAPFIAYGVFCISRMVFRKDYLLFSQGPPPDLA